MLALYVGPCHPYVGSMLAEVGPELAQVGPMNHVKREVF